MIFGFTIAVGVPKESTVAVGDICKSFTSPTEFVNTI
jgi:hypothetical protein